MSTVDSPATTGQLPRPPVLRLAETALFADLDGTLAAIEQKPQQVGPDRARRRLLAELGAALRGRLAVISGRSLADLDRVLEGGVTAVAAVHGLVRRRSDGEVLPSAGDQAARAASQALSRFASSNSRLIVEDKGLAVALHFRQAPDIASDCREAALSAARRFDLILQEGDMVVELRPRGPDKGAALVAFMREEPFTGFLPVFLGDDLTDETGFAAAERLGGFGVVVGARRPTAARYALADVADARGWLEEALSR